MARFQKIQLISSIIPNISAIFVVFTTFVYCCRTKKYYFELSMKCIPYILIFSLLWNWLLTFDIFWLPYVCTIPVALVFNYLLVLLQNKCISEKQKNG